MKAFLSSHCRLWLAGPAVKTLYHRVIAIVKDEHDLVGGIGHYAIRIEGIRADVDRMDRDLSLYRCRCSRVLGATLTIRIVPLSLHVCSQTQCAKQHGESLAGHGRSLTCAVLQ